MAHAKQTKGKYALQTYPYVKMKDQDVQRNQPPAKKWRPMPLQKVRIAQSKLLHNPFAAKRIANLTEVPPQPEPKDSSHFINPLLTYQKKNEELTKSMALYVKEGHLERKSKEITTLAANNIVDELIESAIESILEEMSDKSPPKAQPTKALSPTSSEGGLKPCLGSSIQ